MRAQTAIIPTRKASHRRRRPGGKPHRTRPRRKVGRGYGLWIASGYTVIAAALIGVMPNPSGAGWFGILVAHRLHAAFGSTMFAAVCFGLVGMLLFAVSGSRKTRGVQ